MDTFVKWNGKESVDAWHRRCEKKVLNNAMKFGSANQINYYKKKVDVEGEISVDGVEYPIAALPYIDTIFKTPANSNPESDAEVYAVYGGEKRVHVTTMDFKTFHCSWIDPTNGILIAFVSEKIRNRKNRSFADAKKIYAMAVEALADIDADDKKEVSEALRPIYTKSREGEI